MMLEHSNLTTGAQLVAETLREQYGIEPGPLFASVGLGARRLHVAGARYPAARLVQLWHGAVAATGDPCFGLAVLTGKYLSTCPTCAGGKRFCRCMPEASPSPKKWV